MKETSLLLFSLAFLLLLIPISLYRAVKGPDLFNRLIGLNGIATKSILILIFAGAYTGQLDMFIDIGLSYGMLNLVGSVAIGKYLERKGIKE